MTLLSSILEAAETGLEEAHQLARLIITKTLLPQTLTRPTLQKYIRKAIQNHSWHKLKPEQRALLYTASKTITRVRNQTLYNILAEILLTIELATTKAKAIYYGAILLIKQAPNKAQTLLTHTKNILSKLLYLGINYLNNPPIYRIYG